MSTSETIAMPETETEWYILAIRILDNLGECDAADSLRETTDADEDEIYPGNA